VTRTAQDIGRTAVGPRPLPPLGDQRVVDQLATVDTVLDNGLRVVVVRRPAVPMVELRLRIPFGAGAAGDDGAASHSARAELLATSLLTGTGRRDRMRIDTDLASIGGELDTGVDPERLIISGSALAGGLGQLLDVLADVLTDPAYPADEVGRERGRLVERIAVARAQPGVIAREALQHRRYGDHPFAREMPQAEDVAAATADQVRELHRAAVLPRGAVLVLVGDVDQHDAVAVVDKALSGLSGWRSERSTARMPGLPDVRGDELLLVNRPGAVQSQLRLSARAIPRTDPRYPALQLANLAFGGYFSSRLVENIREDKGYTYHARSSLEFAGGTASLLVDSDTASEATAAALLETRYELGRLGIVPPSKSEVDSVREYAIGALLISTSSQSGLAWQLAALTGVGLDADWLRDHPARLAAVTADEITEAALTFFAPPAWTGVIVGDAELLTPQLSALGGVSIP
jgi:predicted Zn-dependent peptidase